MRRRAIVKTIFLTSVAMLTFVSLWRAPAFAQEGDEPRVAAGESHKAPSRVIRLDPYDRVSQLWYFQRLAKSGWQRGEEIYYMRCWICHNDYTTTAEPGAAPTLRDLYKKESLVNGEEVNDQTVAAFIRSGTNRMPAYGPKYFRDADLADLLAYLRDCCYDARNPPPNFMFRAKHVSH